MTSLLERWRGDATSLATFGDSITQALHIEPPELRWSNRLASALGVSLANKGLGGTVLQRSTMHTGVPRPGNGRERYEADLLGPDRADLVAILYGFNDARYIAAPSSFGHDNFTRDYREVLTGLLAAGYALEAICIGSPPHIPDAGFAVGTEGFAGQSRAEFQRYTGTIKAIAREFGTFYAPVNERMGAEGGDSLILPDHVHPNAAGHAKIAEIFAAATRL